MSAKLQEFKVGEQVRHFSGIIGKVIDINNGIVYITYPDGQRSRCNLAGYPLRNDTDDKQVVFKLTKLERALS